MSAPPLSRRWSIAWAIMFVLNVLASMVLGFLCSSTLGLVGMIAAVTLLYRLGVLLLRRAPDLGKGLVVGSLIPFFLQFCVFIHIASAALAIEIWLRLSGNDFGIETGPFFGFVGAFFVTLVMALPFVLMALILGSLITTAYEEGQDDEPESVT